MPGQETRAQREVDTLNTQLSTLNPRSVEIVDAGMRKAIDLRIICPVDDLRHPSEGSVWPAIHRELYDLVKAHNSTIIFANTRRMVERITVGINDLAGEELVQPHHGSISAPIRRATEERLKKGLLKGVVATGTLELGIDMGAVDLVCQVESPKEISRGLQRVGRAGHLYSAVSKGRILPKTPTDLAESVAVASGMLAGDVEPISVPKNCLDILAQQIVAVAALGSVDSREIYHTVRRAYPYVELSEELFNRVLQMVSGRYPSKAFRDLRPRVSLDRISGRVAPLPGSQRLVIANGGAIPDTGEYGVYLADTNLKLGELDEEFVFEAREGDTFSLGTNVWRISRIEADRVIVSPSGSILAQPPFWRGESVPRTAHVGKRMGALLREIAERGDDALEWAEKELPIDHGAAQNLIGFVRSQVGATDGEGLPTDRRIVLETFKDEIGERRLAVLTTYGGRIHQALRIALVALFKQELGLALENVVSDNGILFRLPAGDAPPPCQLFKRLTPDVACDLILEELPNTALFGLRFRQNAARALLLPGARPGKRTPLWLQRLKARDLLQIAKSFDAFPIVVETFRECLQDYLELSALQDLLAKVQSGEVEVAVSERQTPSPFVSSMLVDFQLIYQYEWDEPKGTHGQRRVPTERRLVAELVGGRLGRKLDERAIADLDAQLQGTGDRWKCRTAEELYELLRRLGDLTHEECLARTESAEFIDRLAEEGQIVLIEAVPPVRWIASDYLEEYSAATFRPVQEAIIERYISNRAAVTVTEIVRRYGFPIGVVQHVIDRLGAERQIVEIAPARGTADSRWCPAEHLEIIYRRTLGIARREAKLATPAEYTEFLLRWQHRHPDSRLRGQDGVRQALRQMEALWLPASIWEPEILARRVSDYRPEYLDAVCSSGEVIWEGRSGAEDRLGRVAFYEREGFAALSNPGERSDSPEHEAVRKALEEKGALFLIDVALATGLDSRVALRALWEMIWKGEVTHDSFRVVRSGKPPELPERRSSPPQGFDHDRRRFYEAKRRILKTFAKPPGTAPGRWTLLNSLRDGNVSRQERAGLMARILLERYGVVARDLLESDLVPWSALYDIYQRMELAGEIERGYYVEGLSGAQFGLPDACDQLMRRRCARVAEEPEFTSTLLLINACDPVLLYAAPGPFAIPDNRLLRLPTNYAVLANGAPALLIELGAQCITPVRELSDEDLAACLAELAHLFDSPWPIRSFRKVEISFWDEDSVIGSRAEPVLRQIGFEKGPKSLVMRKLMVDS